MPNSNLGIRIDAKENVSQTSEKAGRKVRGLGDDFKFVERAAKAMGTAVKSALAGFVGGLAAAGAQMAQQALGRFFESMREQSNDMGREMARLGEIWNRVAKIAGDILAPVIALIADELDKLIPATSKAGDVMESTLVTKLKAIAEGALRWGVNIVEQIATGMAQAAQVVIPAVINAIGGMLTFWLAPGSPPRVAPNLDKWGVAWMETILKGMTEADFDILESIQGPLQSVLSMLGKSGLFADASQSIAAAITSGTGLGSVMDTLRSVGGKFGDSLAELAKKHFNLADAAKAVEEAERRLQESYKANDAAAGAVEKLKNEYLQLKKAGADPAVLAAKEKEINAAQKSADEAAKATTQAEKDLTIAQEKQTETEKQIRLQERLLDQLIKLEQAEVAAKNLASTLATGIAEGIKSGIGAGLSGFSPPTAAFDDLKERIRAKLHDIFKPLKKVWEQQVEPAVDTIRKAWKNLRKILESEELQNALDNFWGPDGFLASIIAKSIPTIMPLLAQLLRTLYDWMVKKFEERVGQSWEDWWGGNGKFVALIKIGLGVGSAAIIQWLAQVYAAITTRIEEIRQALIAGRENWIEIGRGIIGGIITGIVGRAGALAAAAVQAVLDALAAAKAAAGIQSPSKKAMEEIGKPLVAGIGRGIQRYSGMATDPMRGLASDLMSTGRATVTNARYDNRREINSRNQVNNYTVTDEAALRLVREQQRRARLAALGA